jgi:branched-chain amino acid transport system substrate-binding protein
MKALTKWWKQSRCVASVVGAVLVVGPAFADIRVGVLYSSTGPGASVGIPQQRSIDILPKTLGGEKVEYIGLDDGSDPTNAVKNARKLLTEDKVDVIIGPSLSPNALALVDVAAEAQTPMIALAASAAIIEPMDAKRNWVFKTPQNDSTMATIIVQHMLDTDVKTVGILAFNDAYGEGWLREFNKLADLRGIKVVGTERFARTDTSVTGQVLRIVAANPDAVFIAASGTPAVLPQSALAERGYKGKVYQTHGVANNDFLRVGGKILEGTFVPAGPVLVAEQLPNGHPSKAPSLVFIKRYEALPDAGTRSTFAAYLWDATLVLDKAVAEAKKTAQPGTAEFRKALRDAIEKTRDLVATNGVYNMSPKDHLGLDQRSRVMTQIRDGKWMLIQ